MGLKRMVERNRLKAARKLAKNAVRDVSSAVDAMPKMCTGCGVEFDTKKYPKQLDEWRVQIENENFVLLCLRCQHENA